MGSETFKKVSFKRADAVIPLPEALTAFRSDTDSSVRAKWEVQEILKPEDTSVNFSTRTFKTTVLRDEASKFYRNRENIRIRISVNDSELFESLAKSCPPGLLQSAEEVRINHVSKSIGFNTDVLKNGSETTLGERLAEDGTGIAWNILVTHGLSFVGTKAFNSLLVGVRRKNEEWANQLREMSNEIVYSMEKVSLSYLTDTTSWKHQLSTGEIVEIPFGFRFAQNIAEIAEKYILSTSDISSRPGDMKDDPGVSIGFAPLVIDESVKRTKVVQKSLMRKYKSDSFGTDIRYPERLLTDPHRRIFGRKKPIDGGIVLIDTSGSMSLSDEDIKAILDVAPGALVMAYSHRSNSTNVPNLFILADRGKQVPDVSTVPYRNGGNGVDGPALNYAIKRRLRKEEIIWVCDGLVTGADDTRNWELSMYCARLVVKHNIKTAYTVSNAIEMLRKKKYVSKPTNLQSYIVKAREERRGF